MFGIIRPCRHSLTPDLRASWMAHLCGLCLALRDEHGQPARLATNYDGLVVSVLYEAQTAARHRRAGPCLLRGMRAADVAVGDGARLAAAVSLALAAAKAGDHVADGDGWLGRRPVAAAATAVARRSAAAAARTGGTLGFDTGALLAAAARQRALEAAAGPGTPLTAVTEPSETASAAAFAHTAVLASRPGNVEPLRAAGRSFGRIAHLVDAVEDLEADRRSGAWNPLLATRAGLDEARRACDEALAALRDGLRRVEFADARLVHRLLEHEVGHAVHRAFRPALTGPVTYPPPPAPGTSGPPVPDPGPAPPAPGRRPRQPDGDGGGGDWGDGCCCRCDACDCCDCCSSCDCPGH